MSIQESPPAAQTLLRSGEGSSDSRTYTDNDNERSRAFPVSCNGIKADARIDADGAFEYLPRWEHKVVQSCAACSCTEERGHMRLASADIVGASLREKFGFCIWYSPVTNPGSKQRHRKLQQTKTFVCKTQKAAEIAVRTLQLLNCWWGRGRPPRLIVILNPASGKGRAKSVWSKQCLPILRAAGLEMEVTETLHSKHGTEVVQQVNIGNVDAIVCVGGDGSMSEILQGLFSREDWRSAIETPLCLIPAGTGNGMSASGGLWTPVTATHAICKGRTSRMDVATVLQASGRRWFSFLSLTFGLIANLDIGTESLRWMGSMRSQLGAVLEILKANEHIANVAVLPSIAATAAPIAQCSSTPSASYPATPLLDALGTLTELGGLSSVSLPLGWRLLERSSFSLFAVSIMPWLALDFSLVPGERLDSGEMSLTHLPGRLSRCEGLRIMSKADAGKIEEVKKVSVEKVVAFVLDPISTGTWVVMDGEVLPYERTFVELHTGICCAIVAS